MKFTTPATASEPYSAVAPSFNVSIRSKAIIGGSAEVSTKLLPRFVVTALCTWRRELSRTRVEFTPRPRRLIFVVPVLAFWVNASGLFWDPVLMVNRSMMSLISLTPRSAISSKPMVVSGEGESNCDSLRMYEPVTMTSSMAPGGCTGC